MMENMTVKSTRIFEAACLDFLLLDESCEEQRDVTKMTTVPTIMTRTGIVLVMIYFTELITIPIVGVNVTLHKIA